MYLQSSLRGNPLALPTLRLSAMPWADQGPLRFKAASVGRVGACGPENCGRSWVDDCRQCACAARAAAGSPRQARRTVIETHIVVSFKQGYSGHWQEKMRHRHRKAKQRICQVTCLELSSLKMASSNFRCRFRPLSLPPSPPLSRSIASYQS